MIEPIAIAPCIPCAPTSPVSFRMIVANKSVAIAIPDTGLLELPTRPTILEDTVAKKNPKITTMIAPTSVTGIAGTSHTSSVRIRIAIKINFMLRSCAVRSLLSLPTPPFMLFMASRNVRTISGRDLIRLMIPPAASAPAPIYLM